VKILIACEESQAVCIEMRRLGHEAYSCDIQECSGGHPEWHIKGDALELLKMKWDMIIAHPPCTYLSAAGAQRLFNKGGIVKDPERFASGVTAAEFFMAFLNADCPRIAVENPVPLKCFGLPKYSQIIEPYQFGHPWQKRTCLWLKGLPPLTPTEIVKPTGFWVQRSGQRAKGFSGGHRSKKMRSKTFPGIAKAMSEQWAGRCEENESD
jgi:hypothetical protein